MGLYPHMTLKPHHEFWAQGLIFKLEMHPINDEAIMGPRESNQVSNCSWVQRQVQSITAGLAQAKLSWPPPRGSTMPSHLMHSFALPHTGTYLHMWAANVRTNAVRYDGGIALSLSLSVCLHSVWSTAQTRACQLHPICVPHTACSSRRHHISAKTLLAWGEFTWVTCGPLRRRRLGPK